jgi:KUP system potassium uptake protein
MLATTITYGVVALRVFHWHKRFLFPAIAVFIVLDAVFVLSGLPKFIDGAWIPLAISAVIAAISLTWLRGRRALARALAEDQQPIEEFLRTHERPREAQQQAVFLTHDPHGMPFVRNHPWIAPFVRDKTIVLLNLAPAARPYVEPSARIRIERIDPTFLVVVASFGYMEQPRMGRILDACAQRDIHLHDPRTAFFYAAPAIVKRSSGGMRHVQRVLFLVLTRLARSLVDDLDISPTQRAALGVEVAL